MRLSSRLILALALVLPVIRAHAELPTTDDPLPFAEIDYATTQRDAPADESSISDQATRPSEPISTIDHRGDPDLIEFRGLAQVSADDIRKALRWDPKFQAAARPSNNTAVFLNVLESRVLDGFQSSGFPDAKVAVSLDTATRRFVVAVTEGPRFRQGKIVVTGDDRVDAKQIADWLTHEQKPHLWKIRYADAAAPAPPEKGVTLWESGENLNFTPRVRGIFEAGVRMALIEQGFPYASFDLEYVPASEPGLSDLHVNLRHVGAPSTIKEIKVEGLNRDTREQLLEYLQIAPGQRFDPASLDRVHSKLEDSCRYWCHKIEVHCGQKPDGRYAPTDESVNLELELVEFSPAPPLHQALSEVDEVLRKATDWLNRYPRGVEQDLVFEVTARGKKVDEGNLTILPSAASADGRLALNCRFQKPGKWSFDHTLLSSPSETALVDWRAKEKFVSSVLNRVKLNLDIAASLKEDGTYGGRLKAGWTVSGDKTESENSGGIWTVHAEPVALIHIAHTDDPSAKIEHGVLKIKSPRSVLEFNAESGALIRLVAHDKDGPGKVSFKMVLGGYDKIATPLVKRAYSFPNRYDSEQPITSLFEFAVAQCQRQPCIKNHETLARAFKAAEVLSKFATIQRVLRSADQKCLELWNRDSTASDGPNFHVTLTSPNDEATIANTINTSLTCFTPAIIDELFSRGSWPWTLSREAALGFLADGTADEPSEYWYRVATELGRLERSAQLGPAAAWCCLELVDRATQDHSADTLKAWVAECGLRQTSGPQLAQDIELFAAADAYWASTLQDLVDDFVSLPAEERQELLALLPKPWAQALTEIQQRRADKPDEATGEALAHVLRNRWQDLAGKAIEKRLRDYAASTISTPSTAAKPSTPSQQR